MQIYILFAKKQSLENDAQIYLSTLDTSVVENSRSESLTA